MCLPNKKQFLISLLTAICISSQIPTVYAANNVDVAPPEFHEVESHLENLYASSDELPTLEVPQIFHFEELTYQLDRVALLKDHELDKETPNQMLCMIFSVLNIGEDKENQYSRIWSNQVILSSKTPEPIQIGSITSYPLQETPNQDSNTYQILMLYPVSAEIKDIFVSIYSNAGVQDFILNLEDLGAMLPQWGLYVNKDQNLKAYLFDWPMLYLVYQADTLPQSMKDLPEVSVLTWDDISLSSKAQEFLDQRNFVPDMSDYIVAVEPSTYKTMGNKTQLFLNDSSSPFVVLTGLEDWNKLQDAEGNDYVLASVTSENSEITVQEELSTDSQPIEEASQSPKESSGLDKALKLFQSVNPDRIIYAEEAYYDAEVDGYRIPTDLGTYLVFASGEMYTPEGDVFNRNIYYFPSYLQKVIDILAEFRGNEEGIDFDSIRYDDALDAYSVQTSEGSYQVFLDGRVITPQ